MSQLTEIGGRTDEALAQSERGGGCRIAGGLPGPQHPFRDTTIIAGELNLHQALLTPWGWLIQKKKTAVCLAQGTNTDQGHPPLSYY